VELKGCASGQRAVATLLSRLRTVDGVTRVSLSKSTRPELTVNGPGTATPEAGGCGKGRTPAFEIVMFFEFDKTPATVQDVTVATTAPAAGTTAPGQTAKTGATGTPSPTPTPASTPASTPTG
jgi:hypothetical protein